MKKEYLIVSAIFLFFLSYVLDFLAGNVNIVVATPIAFFASSILTKYPLTAVEIFCRSVAIVISVLIVVDELEKRPFIKATALMVISMLAGFYAVQQLATNGTITPIQWTLALAYSAALFVPFVFYYILRGIFKALFTGLSGKSNEEAINNGQSIVEPPNNPNSL